MKIIGTSVLLLGLLLSVVGLAGAVMNFVFPPADLVCEIADEDYAKAQEAVKKYEAAKGTPEEDALANDAKRTVSTAQSSQAACGRMKDGYRTYGIIFSVVAMVGFFVVLVGVGGVFLGFRKKKA